MTASEERTRRQQMIDRLAKGPVGVSGLARAFGLRRRDVAAELPHLLQTAAGAGFTILVVPARCRACGFVFPEDKLERPSKCPACRESRIYEPMLRLDRANPA